ncbi:hypothetical protein BH10PSE6_BH10PSE6_29510 [soil metagenome]
MIFNSRRACRGALLAGLIFLSHPAARAETPGSAQNPSLGAGDALDFVWSNNPGSLACPRRPLWSIAIQGTNLLLKSRNFDFQAIPIALRGDGSASMDRVIQPGRNVKYRVSGSFDGRGRLRLRLQDLMGEGEPCSWRFEAEYQDGIVPGVKAARSTSPEAMPNRAP